MREVTIGLIQMSCSKKQKDNLEKVIKGIEDCATKGAQIIATSELFLSKYFCQGKDDKNFALAETIPGPTTEILGKIAKEKKLVLVVSLYEKTTENKYFNTTVILGTKGEILGKYHKMHIPSLPPDLYAEDYYFSKGDRGFPVFKTPYGKISAPICYDQWFPEAARISAVKGAEVIFYPTAIGWPDGPRKDGPSVNQAEHEAWQIMQRSHSIANNVFVAAINRTGKEGNLNFWGTSFVSDPYGRVITKASTDKEENLVIKIDLDLIKEMRKEWPFLEERRIFCEKLENQK